MRLVTGGIAVLAAVCVAGCGSSGQTRQRDAVNAYFDRIDHAEASLVAQSTTIDETFAKFKIAGNSPAEVRRLGRAHDTIAATLRKVRAVRPPTAARKIHGEILQLLVLQDAVAADLVRTTSYVPQLGRSLVPLQRADQTLQRDLAQLDQSGQKSSRVVKPPTLAVALAGFAAAFDRFGASLQGVSVALDRLDPPLELRAELLVQRHAVRRSVTLCSAIVAALGRKDIATANADIHTLFTLASQTSVIGSPQAEAKALGAYDARLQTIVHREVAITAERSRLIRSVG